MEGLNEKEARAKFSAEPVGKRKIELAVQLNSVQAGGAESEGDFVEILGVKNADLGEIEGRFRHHVRDLTGCDPAWAGCEDEAGGIGTGIRGQQNIFESGVAADLDPHESQACWAVGSGAWDSTERSNSSRAAPGCG